MSQLDLIGENKFFSFHTVWARSSRSTNFVISINNHLKRTLNALVTCNFFGVLLCKNVAKRNAQKSLAKSCPVDMFVIPSGLNLLLHLYVQLKLQQMHSFQDKAR